MICLALSAPGLFADKGIGSYKKAGGAQDGSRVRSPSQKSPESVHQRAGETLQANGVWAGWY
jgi:hypothetical protein